MNVRLFLFVFYWILLTLIIQIFFLFTYDYLTIFSFTRSLLISLGLVLTFQILKQLKNQKEDMPESPAEIVAKFMYDKSYNSLKDYNMPDNQKRVLAVNMTLITVDKVLEVIYLHYGEENNGVYDLYAKVKFIMEEKAKYEWL